MNVLVEKGGLLLQADAGCGKTYVAKQMAMVLEQVKKIVAKTHEMLYIHTSFSTKRPYTWVIFCKRALYLVALLQKMTCNARHPMGLRHPVLFARSCIYWYGVATMNRRLKIIGLFCRI